MVRVINHQLKWSFQRGRDGKYNTNGIWLEYLIDYIIHRASPKLSGLITQDFLNPIYYEIILYFSIEQIVENCNSCYDTFKITDQIEIPYRLIISKNYSAVLNKIESVHGSHLTKLQSEFVVDNFKAYLNKQDPTVFSDPDRFYSNLKIRVDQQIKDLTGETNWLKDTYFFKDK